MGDLTTHRDPGQRRTPRAEHADDLAQVVDVQVVIQVVFLDHLERVGFDTMGTALCGSVWSVRVMRLFLMWPKI